MTRKVALVLSGCGVNDGTEIHEAVSMLVALGKAGCAVECFAPDRPQRDVIDHAAGKPAAETRGILAESARIARGKIAPLERLDAAAFDGLAFPGGFGAAKNLCDFAVAGADLTVAPDVERVLRAFRGARKPILAVCIAPALVARAFGKEGVKFTIGDDAGTAKALSAAGGTHVVTDKRGVCVDEKLKIVTAPAYMLCESPAEVFDNVSAAVAEFKKLM